MAGEVTGGTFNEKWIDGGTAATNPRFDVDDPTFWTPMSVISGLASGFCERLAVVSDTLSETAPAATTDVQKLLNNFSWRRGATTAADIAINAATTSKCADNIAINSPLESTFSAIDGGATMHLIGDQAHSYMPAMDARIAVLVSQGGFMQSAATPVPYYFTGNNLTLATAASARASTAGSAMTSPNIASNGGVLAETFRVATPVKWAIQRKWLLDELRYADGPGDVISSSLSYECFSGYMDPNYSTTVIQGSQTLNTSPATTLHASGNMDMRVDYNWIPYQMCAELKNTSVQAPDTAAITVYVTYPRPLVGNLWARDYASAQAAEVVRGTVNARDVHAYYVVAGGTLSVGAGISATDVTIEPGAKLVMKAATARVGVINRLTGVDTISDATEQGSVTFYRNGATVYCPADNLEAYDFGTPGNDWRQDTTASLVTNTTTPAGSLNQNIYVCDGGVLSIAKEIELLTIASTAPPVQSGWYYYNSSSKKLFKAVESSNHTYTWSEVAIDTNAIYYNNANDRYYYWGSTDLIIRPTGDASLISSDNRLYVSGGTITHAAPNNSSYIAIVDRGGLLDIKGGAVEWVTVLPGGTVSISDADTDDISKIDMLEIFHDGAINITAQATNGSKTFHIGDMTLFPGATCSIAAGVIPTQTNNSIPQSYIGGIECSYICSYGLFGDSLENPIKQGWMTFDAIKITGYTYQLAGTSVVADGKTTITSFLKPSTTAANNGLVKLYTQIKGTTYIGTNQLTTAEAIANRKTHDGDDTAVFGFDVVALNRPAGGLKNYYTEFKCRQAEIDPPTANN